MRSKLVKADTFFDFMMQYKGLDSADGDLAGDMWADGKDKFPNDRSWDLPTERKRVKAYLQMHGSCADCMAVFKMCWHKYYMSRYFSKNAEKIKRQRIASARTKAENLIEKAVKRGNVITVRAKDGNTYDYIVRDGKRGE